MSLEHPYRGVDDLQLCQGTRALSRKAAVFCQAGLTAASRWAREEGFPCTHSPGSLPIGSLWKRLNLPGGSLPGWGALLSALPVAPTRSDPCFPRIDSALANHFPTSAFPISSPGC